jgi:hypothetical protein
MVTILAFEIKEGKKRTKNKKIINNNLSFLKPGAHTAILVGRFKFRCMILANLAM